MIEMLTGPEKWKHLPTVWVWIFNRPEDYAFAETLGLASCMVTQGIHLIGCGDNGDDIKDLEGRKIAIPFVRDEAEEAVMAAKSLAASGEVYLIEIPETEKIKNFSEWIVSLYGGKKNLGEADMIDIAKKVLWGEIKKTIAYYPGWEHDGEFDRLQKSELAKIRLGGKFNLTDAKETFSKRMSAMFDGLNLESMDKTAANLNACVQYIIEELLKKKKSGYLLSKSEETGAV
jgi:hypothetical protein